MFGTPTLLVRTYVHQYTWWFNIDANQQKITSVWAVDSTINSKCGDGFCASRSRPPAAPPSGLCINPRVGYRPVGIREWVGIVYHIAGEHNLAPTWVSQTFCHYYVWTQCQVLYFVFLLYGVGRLRYYNTITSFDKYRCVSVRFLYNKEQKKRDCYRRSIAINTNRTLRHDSTALSRATSLG